MEVRREAGSRGQGCSVRLEGIAAFIGAHDMGILSILGGDCVVALICEFARRTSTGGGHLCDLLKYFIPYPRPYYLIVM